MKKKILAVTMIVLIIGCKRKNQSNVNFSHLQNMEDVSDTIELTKEAKVRVYCTGELKPDWANVSREYIGQDDDIEVFFRQADNNIKKIIFKESDKKGDTLVAEIDQVKCIQHYDKVLEKYVAFITIPRKLVLNKTRPDSSFEFDIAIGDNDDGIKQKAKLCWAGHKDPLFEGRLASRIVITDHDSVSQDQRVAIAKKITHPATDLAVFPRYLIGNLVAGQVNDVDDLSGFFRTGWDNDNIYLLLEIKDSEQRKFRNEILAKDDNFVDRGWIEDLKGKKIWQMNLIQSKPGGGALKNQYCDTLLSLVPGKYVVKYSTDESHAWNAWDAPAPKKKFWGITVSSK
ncbi:hypothetical protein H9N25_13645 [Pedobacter riviphilus]|uniref:Carbohydrate-binding domain-containing protein n=1 Tax=Pedobacter riviphilus TaxID=2766984 RepID=A0ABX6TDM7_9SPHI|nr:hypothetical protein [Pedobacter riviphilus]QNR83020.1 hypothetical protein H9N25_13645 [Pedobacter riviphilus]